MKRTKEEIQKRFIEEAKTKAKMKALKHETLSESAFSEMLKMEPHDFEKTLNAIVNKTNLLKKYKEEADGVFSGISGSDSAERYNCVYVVSHRPNIITFPESMRNEVKNNPLRYPFTEYTFSRTINETVIDDRVLDEEGYMYFRVKPEKPKELILFFIGQELDNWRKARERRKKKGWMKERIPVSFNRFRKEQIDALKVWEEWQNIGVSAKKGFPSIARKLSMPLSTVKTRWYKAYSIIHGKPYDPQKVKRELGDKASELCSKCTDAKCYKENKGGNMYMIPCPAYLKLTGKKYQKEKTMTDKQVNYTHFGELAEN